MACHRKIPTLGANVANNMMDGWKNNVALAHPYHIMRLCSQFGYILSSGLGGDSMMDRWMDGWKNNVALAYPYHTGWLCRKFG